MAPIKSKTQQPGHTYNLRSRLTRLRSGMQTRQGGGPDTANQSRGPVQRKVQQRKNNRSSASDKKPNTGMKCAICLDTVRAKKMQCMPCGHSFHEKCCGRWLTQSSMCPVCRTPVLTNVADFPEAPLSNSSRNSRRPRTRRRRHVVIRQRYRDMLLSSTSVIIIDVYRFHPPPPQVQAAR